MARSALTACAVLLIALTVPACVSVDIPDEPLPGRDELVAAFGAVAPGTVVLRERDLSSSVTCTFDDVFSQGLDGGDLIRVDAPPYELRGTNGMSVSGEADRRLALSSQPPVAVGDTLALSGLAGGCDDNGGEGRVVLYVVGREAGRVQAVFAGDFHPIRSATGIRVSQGVRLLGAFDLPATSEEP